MHLPEPPKCMELDQVFIVDMLLLLDDMLMHIKLIFGVDNKMSLLIRYVQCKSLKKFLF